VVELLESLGTEESSESLGTEELLFDELHEEDNKALTDFIKSLNMGRKEDALVLKVK